ncbi:PQQ-dependent sugar dehydrogenase [Siphonobacter sp. SORGH_AS_1065]|uniref:PQQ-dependent sugar dehydrogenase n=1 Tax=Siphonobacter sp. SORGH_AS_1065 TaxID=3041795 RepID=UPI002784D0CE|nr:PQQ-dependent sugar dehydrogenase [Siphonobacter sp. SORGH_AS_1065]MDQ1085580.1 cytochrome c [Siphonobacter sp. SORGH_AS_1065]
MKIPVLVLGILGCLTSYTFSKKTAFQAQPDSSRFTSIPLVQGLDEPMGIAILPNNDVLIAERKGGLRKYDASQKQLLKIATLNVFSGIEDGFLGITADPNYEQNHWIYLYYGVGGDRWVSQLARYEFRDNQLVTASKKVLLEIPTQRKYCCHSAGYLTFSKQGELYLATGDNTNAEEIEGHNPTDERPGRELSDDQASTANSNDLRGKILRIKPEADGTYSIPDGNLFPKDGSKGRPEIYVMGCRNPFRISVDPKNGFVYWGDVGPDTQVPAEEGTLSYDEINQARKPGFFGYPYFLGNNEAFPKYDFATKKEGPKQDPAHPVNNSPHNTGLKELPAAQPALIWYGKGPSKRWPLVGKGGASAMAGPVYYQDEFKNAPYRLPAYYEGKVFIYDWIRRWIMAVTLDEKGNYQSMEPFLSHLNYVAPIDMQFNRDGSIYLLAYGTNWFANNADAGLYRIEYAEGNRRPIADIQANQTVGAAPLKVSFSAANSKDYDPEDSLRFSWKVGSRTYPGKELTHVFTKVGIHPVLLTVTDSKGAESTTSVQVKVGNTPPTVQIQSAQNQSFYWDKSKLDYRVSIKDPEDQRIDPKRTQISFTYLPFGKDMASVLTGNTHQISAHAQGKSLFEASDCKSCHALASASIGPSLQAIAQKYKGTKVLETLTEKVIKGGSGVWGKYAMSPHPDLPKADAQEMVSYILSLGDEQKKLPSNGSLTLTGHEGKSAEGAYVFLAQYTDQGAHGIEALTTRKHLLLRNPLLQMEDNDRGNVGVIIATASTDFVSYIRKIYHQTYVVFNQLDLNGIQQLKYRIQSQAPGGTIELRLDSPQGPLVSSLTVPAAGSSRPEWKEMLAQVKATKGFHDLYFVFVNPQSAPKKELFYVDWVYMEPSRSVSTK